jgi:uncharacterized membrane protein
MLNDIVTLTIGLVLILVSVQMFMDPAKRKIVSEVFKATFIGMAGLFLVYVWSGMSKSNGFALGAPIPYRPAMPGI